MKQFGSPGNYLVKFELKDINKNNKIKDIKDSVKKDLQSEINFRRIENVGPKVSKELLNSGLLAICLSLGAMLFYIWVRFEWQFSVGSIVALLHDVVITIGGVSEPVLKFERLLDNYIAVAPRGLYSFLDTIPKWIHKRLWIKDEIKNH